MKKKTLQNSFTIWPYIHIYVYECLKKLRKTYKMDNSDYLWDQGRFVPFLFTLWCFEFLQCKSISIIFLLSKEERVSHRDRDTCLVFWVMSCSSRIEQHSDPGLSLPPLLMQSESSSFRSCPPLFSPSHFQRGSRISAQHVIHIPLRHIVTQNSYCVGWFTTWELLNHGPILVTLIKLVHNHTPKQLQQQ